MAAHQQPAKAVSEQRQWDRLMAMARIGAIAGDGVNRACLTALDRQARRLLIDWATRRSAPPSRSMPPPISGCAARAPTRTPPRCSPAATWTPSRTAAGSTASTA